MTINEKSRLVIARGLVKMPGARPRISIATAALAILAAALVCTLAANSVSAAPQAAPSVKLLKFKGLVVTANSAVIIVRDPQNSVRVMSFSFSPAVRDQMLKILTAGGYRYGDKVTVEYAPGTTVALKLHGKPSKAKKQKPPPQSQLQ
jgi:hypothetical protein